LPSAQRHKRQKRRKSSGRRRQRDATCAPPFGRSPARLLFRRISQLELQQQTESPGDVDRPLVPLEELSDVVASRAVRAAAERAENFVRKRVTGLLAEDVQDAGFDVLPNRQGGLQVDAVHVALTVQQGIDAGEPADVSLRTTEQRAAESRPAFGQLAVD